MGPKKKIKLLFPNVKKSTNASTSRRASVRLAKSTKPSYKERPVSDGEFEGTERDRTVKGTPPRDEGDVTDGDDDDYASSDSSPPSKGRHELSDDDMESILQDEGLQADKGRTRPLKQLYLEPIAAEPDSALEKPIETPEVEGRARHLDQFQRAHEEMEGLLRGGLVLGAIEDGPNVSRLRALHGDVTIDRRPIETNIDMNTIPNLRAVFKRDPIRNMHSKVVITPPHVQIRVHSTSTKNEVIYRGFGMSRYLLSYSEMDLHVIGQWMAAFFSRYPVSIEEMPHGGTLFDHAVLVAAIYMATSSRQTPSASLPGTIKVGLSEVYYNQPWSKVQMAWMAILHAGRDHPDMHEIVAFRKKYFPPVLGGPPSRPSDFRTAMSKSSEIEYDKVSDRCSIPSASRSKAMKRYQEFKHALERKAFVPPTIKMPRIHFLTDRGSVFIAFSFVTLDPLTTTWDNRSARFGVRHVDLNINIPNVASYYSWEQTAITSTKITAFDKKAVLTEGNLDYLSDDIRRFASDAELLGAIELSKYIQVQLHGMLILDKDYKAKLCSVFARFLKQGWTQDTQAKSSLHAEVLLYPGRQRPQSFWRLTPVALDGALGTQIRFSNAAILEIRVQGSIHDVSVLVSTRNHARLVSILEPGLQTYLMGFNIWQAMLVIAQQADLEEAMLDNDEVTVREQDGESDVDDSGAFHVCIGCLSPQPKHTFRWSPELQIELCSQISCQNRTDIKDTLLDYRRFREPGMRDTYLMHLRKEAAHMSVVLGRKVNMDATEWEAYVANQSVDGNGKLFFDEYVASKNDPNSRDLRPSSSVGSGFVTATGKEHNALVASLEARDSFVRDPGTGRTGYHVRSNNTSTSSALNILKSVYPRTILHAAKEIHGCDTRLEGSASQRDDAGIAILRKKRASYVQLVANISISLMSVGHTQSSRIGSFISEKDMASYHANWTANAPLPKHLQPPRSLLWRMPDNDIRISQYAPTKGEVDWMLEVLRQASSDLGYKRGYLWGENDSVPFPFSDSAKAFMDKADWTIERLWVYFGYKLRIMKRSCNRYWKTTCTIIILVVTVTISFMQRPGDGDMFIGFDIWPFARTPGSSSIGKRRHNRGMHNGFLKDGEPTVTPTGYADYHDDICNIVWETVSSNFYKHNFDERQLPDLIEQLGRIFPPERLLGVSSETLLNNIWAWESIEYASEDSTERRILPDNASLQVCDFDDIEDDDNDDDDGYEPNPSEETSSESEEYDSQSENPIGRGKGRRAPAPQTKNPIGRGSGRKVPALLTLKPIREGTELPTPRPTGHIDGNTRVLVPQLTRSRGFLNPGLFCYQNSTCHTIYNILPIRERILGMVFPDKTTVLPARAKTRFEVVRQLQMTLKEIGTPSSIRIDPRSLAIACVASGNNSKPGTGERWSGRRNEDPQEFLAFLMENLHMVEHYLTTGEWAEIVTDIDHVLGLATLRQYECEVCHDQGEGRPELATSVELSLPDSIGSVTLDDMLDKYGKAETVEANCQNMIFSEQERANHNRRKNTEYFTSLPPYLVLGVKRYGYVRGAREGYKLMNDVPAQLDLNLLLHLPPHLRQSPRQEHMPLYELDSEIRHIGEDLQRGHYISFNRTGDPGVAGEWTKFDDQTETGFKRVSPVVDRQGDVYMLVYKQKSVVQTPTSPQGPAQQTKVTIPSSPSGPRGVEGDSSVAAQEEDPTTPRAGASTSTELVASDEDALLKEFEIILATIPGNRRVQFMADIHQRILEAVPNESILGFARYSNRELAKHVGPHRQIENVLSTVADADLEAIRTDMNDMIDNRLTTDLAERIRPVTPPQQYTATDYYPPDSKEHGLVGMKRDRNPTFDDHYAVTEITPRRGRNSRSSKRIASEKRFAAALKEPPPPFKGFEEMSEISSEGWREHLREEKENTWEISSDAWREHLIEEKKDSTEDEDVDMDDPFS